MKKFPLFFCLFLVFLIFLIYVPKSNASYTYDNINNCTNEANCLDAGGLWYNNKCLSEDQAVCSKDYPPACENKADCEYVGGVWENDQCELAHCTETNLDACDILFDCEDVGGLWKGDHCEPMPSNECTHDTLFLCTNEADCLREGGYWNGTKCETPCGYDSLEGCTDDFICAYHGGVWTNLQCKPVCSLYYINSCKTENECKSVGGEWDQGRCNPPLGPVLGCNKDNVTGCNNHLDCLQNGGLWINFNNKCIKHPENKKTPMENYLVDYLWSSPALDENIEKDIDIIYIGGTNNYSYHRNKPGNDTVKWKFKAGDKIYSSPAVNRLNGIIYFGSWDTKVYAVTPDGNKLWEFATGDKILSSPAIGDNGTIYIGSNDGKFYAINFLGIEEWHFSTGAPIHSSPVINEMGLLSFASFNGYLFTLNTLSAGLDMSSWPKFRKDNLNTGRVERICSLNSLYLCNDNISCVQIGGIWDNVSKKCKAHTVCSQSNLTGCLNQKDCENAGGDWDNSSGKCITPVCSKDHLFNCTTQKDCENAGGAWNSNLGTCIPLVNGKINIFKGWNLVALPVFISNGINPKIFEGSNINTVWKWFKNTWQIWSPNTKIIEIIEKYGLATINLLSSGEGFW